MGKPSEPGLFEIERREEISSAAIERQTGLFHRLEPALRLGRATQGGLGPHSRDIRRGRSFPLHELWLGSDHGDQGVRTLARTALSFAQEVANEKLSLANSSINYCVRWESSSSVTKAQRDEISTVLAAQYAKWFSWVSGYDSFPYGNISVKVVGWAVKDTSLLEGDTSDIDVYTDVDADGIPQCAPACGRFFHQDGDYSGCSAGEDRHYDQSFWLTDGEGGGMGGDWGQRMGTEVFLDEIGLENIEILLHEMVSFLQSLGLQWLHSDHLPTNLDLNSRGEWKGSIQET